LFFILHDILKDDSIRTVLVYGGKSSGKTLSIAQLLAHQSVINKGSSMVFRKESNTLQSTLKQSFDKALGTMWIEPAFKKYLFSLRCYNGTGIYMKGLDSSEKAKGIEGYKYLYLDELNQFDQREYEQFNLSLRGIKGQKIFASWNPVDENSWVKTALVDRYEWQPTHYQLPCESSFVKRSACGRAILIKTTYEDNYWVSGSPCGTYGFFDENSIAEYKQLQAQNYNSYKVNVLGEWGKTVYGGEILKCWKSELHTGNFPYNPDLAVYLSFDENTAPYFACGFFQIGHDQKTARMIHYIAARHPDNRLRHICNEIKRMLYYWRHQGKIYVGGDPTSQKDDVKQEHGHDLFRLVMNELQELTPTRKTLDGKPSVKDSFEFFNNILAHNDYGIDLKVDSNCHVAITDFENAQEDKNGGVNKTKITDPVTKTKVEPYGHFVDLTRYFLCSAFAKEYADYISNKVKKKHPLRYGVRPPSRNGY